MMKTITLTFLGSPIPPLNSLMMDSHTLHVESMQADYLVTVDRQHFKHVSAF